MYDKLSGWFIFLAGAGLEVLFMLPDRGKQLDISEKAAYF
jgi:hypothetical protein